MATVTKFANSNNGGYTNPTSAYADDGVYATAAPGKNGSVTTDYGFPAFTTSDIPDGATINSVTVEIQFKVSTTSSVATQGLQVINGATALDSQQTNTAEPTADTLLTHQVTSGIALADLRSAGQILGRVTAQRGNSNTAVTFSLDYVKITVDYTVVLLASDSSGTIVESTSVGQSSVGVDAGGLAVGRPAGRFDIGRFDISLFDDATGGGTSGESASVQAGSSNTPVSSGDSGSGTSEGASVKIIPSSEATSIIEGINIKAVSLDVNGSVTEVVTQIVRATPEGDIAAEAVSLKKATGDVNAPSLEAALPATSSAGSDSDLSSESTVLAASQQSGDAPVLSIDAAATIAARATADADNPPNESGSLRLNATDTDNAPSEAAGAIVGALALDTGSASSEPESLRASGADLGGALIESAAPSLSFIASDVDGAVSDTATPLFRGASVDVNGAISEAPQVVASESDVDSVSLFESGSIGTLRTGADGNLSSESQTLVTARLALESLSAAADVGSLVSFFNAQDSGGASEFASISAFNIISSNDAATIIDVAAMIAVAVAVDQNGASESATLSPIFAGVDFASAIDAAGFLTSVVTSETGLSILESSLIVARAIAQDSAAIVDFSSAVAYVASLDSAHDAEIALLSLLVGDSASSLESAEALVSVFLSEETSAEESARIAADLVAASDAGTLSENAVAFIAGILDEIKTGRLSLGRSGSIAGGSDGAVSEPNSGRIG